jgi:RNA polymerase-binding transcription factor DksA
VAVKVEAARRDGGAKGRFTPTRRKLTAAEIREFKQILLRLRARLSGQIHALKSDSLMRNDEVNTVEDGTDAFERQFALNIASSEHDVLFEIDEALRRIELGTFGICEMTGEPIELERLRAIPYTRYSLGAQAEMEKGKAPFRQSAVLKAL